MACPLLHFGDKPQSPPQFIATIVSQSLALSSLVTDSGPVLLDVL